LQISPRIFFDFFADFFDFFGHLRIFLRFGGGFLRTPQSAARRMRIADGGL